jgi:hypothetical protein
LRGFSAFLGRTSGRPPRQFPAPIASSCPNALVEERANFEYAAVVNASPSSVLASHMDALDSIAIAAEWP